MKGSTGNVRIKLLATIAVFCFAAQGCTERFIQKQANRYPHPFAFGFTDSVPGTRASLYWKAYNWSTNEFSGKINIVYDSISHWKFYKSDKSFNEAIILHNEETGMISAQGFIVHPIKSLIGISGYDYIYYKMSITVSDGTYSVSVHNFIHYGDSRYDIYNHDFGSLDSERVRYYGQFGANKEFYRIKDYTSQTIEMKFKELKEAMRGSAAVGSGENHLKEKGL